jgi:vibriolysin
MNKHGYRILIGVSTLLVFGIPTSYAAQKITINQTQSPSTLEKSIVAPEGLYSYHLIKKIVLPNGAVRYRLQQHYNNIPIFNGYLTTDQTSLAKSQKIYGEYLIHVENDLLSTEAAFDEQAAVEYAKTADHIDEAKTPIRNKDVKLMIMQSESTSKAQLIYQVSFVVEGEQEIRRPYFFMNAQTGEILRTWEGLTHSKQATGPGGNEKTGQYTFGKDYGPLIVNDSCQMQTENVETYNLNGGTKAGGIYQFTCPTNTYQAINGAYSPLNDAHYFGGIVFDMYKNYANSSPLTSKLRLNIHYQKNYENAFWDGEQMFFGDGGSTMYPLVSIDVMGHEVSHGFTQQHSNLIYDSTHSGGMNEAYSDMAGEASEYYLNRLKPEGQRVDWLVGGDIIKGPKGTGLRYFADPTRDGVSIGNAKDFYKGLDNHLSSGVYNKAFYTLSNTPNWTLPKAFQLFVIANQVYWKPDSTFDQGACGVKKAADDLQANAQDVIAAFKVVGVDASCGTGGDPMPTPAPTPAPTDPQDPTPDPDPSSKGTEITNGVTLSGLSSTDGTAQYFFINIQKKSFYLSLARFGSFNSSGYPNIYMAYGRVPTETDYDCKAGGSIYDYCSVANPQQGIYTIMMKSPTAYTGSNLSASYYY